MKNNKISRMVQMAVLLGIVIFLQCFFAQIVVGTTSFSVVLVPIVVGAILLGPGAGALLGFAFGAVVLIYGIIGQDAFTNILFVAQPAFTALICLGKGTAAGLLAGIAYRLMAKFNAFWASVAAAAIAPIANTGLFILGGLTLVRGTLEANLSTFGADSVLIFLVLGCAGVNFIVEFGVNMILSPAIYRIITVVKKSFSR
jgi:uncharacterized membrane protein